MLRGVARWIPVEIQPGQAGLPVEGSDLTARPMAISSFRVIHDDRPIFIQEVKRPIRAFRTIQTIHDDYVKAFLLYQRVSAGDLLIDKVKHDVVRLFLAKSE